MIRGTIGAAVLVLLILVAVVTYLAAMDSVCVGGATIEAGGPLVTLETVCSGGVSAP